jgi:hypothetical protein
VVAESVLLKHQLLILPETVSQSPLR